MLKAEEKKTNKKFKPPCPELRKDTLPDRPTSRQTVTKCVTLFLNSSAHSERYSNLTSKHLKFVTQLLFLLYWR